MSLFFIRAHDAVWRDRTIPLRKRVQFCKLLWKAAIIAAETNQ